MTKIRTQNSAIYRKANPSYTDTQLTVRPTGRLASIRIPCVVTYSQPWFYYWIAKIYHRFWCMKARRVLGPIDSIRDQRGFRKAGKSDYDIYMPVDARRDIRCYILSKSRRKEISTQESE